MRNTTACVLDGCERRAGRAGGYCPGHIQRIKRLGHPGPAEFRRSPGSEPPPCSVDDCGRPSNSRGWCKVHYSRWSNGVEFNAPIIPNPKRTRPCKIDGCETVSKAKGWCNAHYQRWYRTGDPGPADLPKYGQFPSCSADGCDREHRTGGWCDMHYRRFKRGVRVDSLKFRKPPPAMDETSYAAVHTRIVAQRGRAAVQICECGSQARQWAYQHNDPNPLYSALGSPYSLHIFTCYTAMCSICHVLLDRDPDEQHRRLLKALAG